MGFWDKAADLAKKGASAVAAEAEKRQEMYDKYYDWASRQSDDRLKEEYKRKKANTNGTSRYLMEMKALTDILHERGYGNN